MGGTEINNDNNISNSTGENDNDNSHTKSSHRQNVSALWKSRKSKNDSTPPVPPKSIHEHTRRGCEYSI